MSEAPSLTGVMAAVATPMTPDLTPDIKRWGDHCRRLLANGCDALAIFGTTGEANSFTADERMLALEALIEEQEIPADKIIVGTGVCALPDAVRLSAHAVDLGAAGCLVLPPFYYKNVHDQGLIDAFTVLIDSVADDRLKVYLYHFPQLAGVPLPLRVVVYLAQTYPQTVVGLKDSSGDFENMRAILQELPGFGLFSGSDEFLLSVLEQGGAGCITAVANVAGFLAGNVLADWRLGDVKSAGAWQEKLTRVRKEVIAYPGTSAVKAILARLDGSAEWLTVRPPLRPLTAAESDHLFARLDEIGVDLG
ncbi:dihydrodipicolinate synthase family protein [Magnetospira sp. QH-2]|uniref:dihydrodipicolinate synthase family protein n=1 Tax=Magnetospira sp. (strain QH-2) TaxID=1288970 RepID=UPI0003E81494|nr:dihydrodipicolinate synthase family protein [Magnetospira sp. QH-2]CCQ75573.1 putative Dihydrodipicolinate synthetase [Magnetospira sp. QH-2]